MSRAARAEITVSAIIIAVCIAMLIESLRLAPGSFEPLGSAPVPQATAVLVLALSLAVIAAAWRRRVDGEAPDGVEEPASAFFMMVLTVAYVGALHSQRIDFGVLTTIYLLVVIWGLERFRARALLPAALVAATVGFGCLMIFTRIFTVDLPTWF